MFAWKLADMPRVPQELIEHSLDVSKTTKPIKQKLRWFARDKKEAIRVEINRLLATGFIKEVYLLEWLANPVLVRKRIINGGCALITPILTNTALRTPLVCLV
jgi:hypothetical protein